MVEVESVDEEVDVNKNDGGKEEKTTTKQMTKLNLMTMTLMKNRQSHCEELFISTIGIQRLVL